MLDYLAEYLLNFLEWSLNKHIQFKNYVALNWTSKHRQKKGKQNMLDLINDMQGTRSGK